MALPIKTTVIVELKPMFSLWTAIKIRIAGFNECTISKVREVSLIKLKKVKKKKRNKKGQYI